MHIALDYDDTYTVDPSFWDEVVTLAHAHGHSVTCITKRGKDNQGELATVTDIETVYTNRRAKQHFCDEHGIRVNVWIDDSPHNLYIDG